MFRSDDNGLTFTTADFFVNSNQTINASLISDLVANGQSVDLKIWNLKKSGTDFISTANSSVSGSNGKTYSIWSRPKTIGSKLYRTGYTTVDSWETGLLESVDNGATWTYKSTIAAIAGTVGCNNLG